MVVGVERISLGGNGNNRGLDASQLLDWARGILLGACGLNSAENVQNSLIECDGGGPGEGFGFDSLDGSIDGSLVGIGGSAVGNSIFVAGVCLIGLSGEDNDE